MLKVNEPQGFRGYIASRPVAGVPYPHRVQNLVIRDYCRRKNLMYLLSSAEISVPGSCMMLNEILNQLDSVAGVVAFSLFMLPQSKTERRAIMERVVGAGKELHAALEDIVIRDAADMDAAEQLIAINAALPATPFGGLYDKDAPVSGRDVFKS